MFHLTHLTIYFHSLNYPVSNAVLPKSPIKICPTNNLNVPLISFFQPQCNCQLKTSANGHALLYASPWLRHQTHWFRSQSLHTALQLTNMTSMGSLAIPGAIWMLATLSLLIPYRSWLSLISLLGFFVFCGFSSLFFFWQGERQWLSRGKVSRREGRLLKCVGGCNYAT